MRGPLFQFCYYMHMKRFAPVIIATLLIAGGIWYGRQPVQNPDPNHTHADFAVWVGTTKLNFSDARYMSEAYDPNSGREIRVDPMRKYLHLHDGNGHVAHRHKPGLTFGEFFASLGITMSGSCITLDDFQYSALDEGWKNDFAITKDVCSNGKFHWQMVINGVAGELNPGYVFNDGDQILFTYSASDTAYLEQWEEMTNDACMYSQTCPWRGDPPTENCIADPEVPCVAPEN